jgi:chemotaxis signal transduction protein
MTVVCFRAGETRYCVPVEAARAVRTTSGMVTLPQARAAVAGVIQGDPPLTVLTPFDATGEKVLVLESAGKVFGVLVDEVPGLARIADARIGHAPHGQGGELVSGTLEAEGELVLLLRPDALVALL